MKKRSFLLCLALALSACAPVISSEYQQKAVKEVGFGQFRDNPDAYANSIFILGGTIASTENTTNGTELEVVQNPINRYGEITDRDVSEGRFILVTTKQLDPMIFRKGRMVTVAAQLTGSRTKQLGEKEYRYPVLEAKEIYLWKREKYPNQQYLYNPYFYPFYYYNYPYYWNDPYFRGPLLYPLP
ncbi:MAG: Slp family lipoprotein [Nitrospiraceae bacterium]|nr:Slp family lipoprotein [Nitrospiraceae bacterium]